jgi:hypothetical protein
VKKHQIVNQNTIINEALQVTPYLQQYKQKLIELQASFSLWHTN